MKYLLAFICWSAFAANKPVYQVEYQLSERGKVVKSSKISVEQGEPGEVSSGSETDKDSLSVTIKPDSKLLSMDYRFKTMKNGKTIELAKTEVTLAPGSTETNEFKDSSGNDFQLKITVTKTKF